MYFLIIFTLGHESRNALSNPYGSLYSNQSLVSKPTVASLSFFPHEASTESWIHVWSRATVSNLFGTRNRFHGRQFFHGLGVVSGWFKNIAFIVHFISNLMLPLICQIWSVTPRLGTPDLEDHLPLLQILKGQGQEADNLSPLLRWHEDLPTFLQSIGAPELLPLLSFNWTF